MAASTRWNAAPSRRGSAAPHQVPSSSATAWLAAPQRRQSLETRFSNPCLVAYRQESSSVVSRSAAMLAAFCNAERVTFVGSTTPALGMSSYWSVAALGATALSRSKRLRGWKWTRSGRDPGRPFGWRRDNLHC
jgi:hypothetical protein